LLGEKPSRRKVSNKLSNDPARDDGRQRMSTDQAQQLKVKIRKYEQ
jgi:hypothetical protein